MYIRTGLYYTISYIALETLFILLDSTPCYRPFYPKYPITWGIRKGSTESGKFNISYKTRIALLRSMSHRTKKATMRWWRDRNTSRSLFEKMSLAHTSLCDPSQGKRQRLSRAHQASWFLKRCSVGRLLRRKKSEGRLEHAKQRRLFRVLCLVTRSLEGQLLPFQGKVAGWQVSIWTSPRWWSLQLNPWRWSRVQKLNENPPWRPWAILPWPFSLFWRWIDRLAKENYYPREWCFPRGLN